MGFDQFITGYASYTLQRVDILRVVTQQQAFVVQQFNKIVTGRRLELARVQFLGESKKWLRIPAKVLDFEYCGWMG